MFAHCSSFIYCQKNFLLQTCKFFPKYYIHHSLLLELYLYLTKISNHRAFLTITTAVVKINLNITIIVKLINIEIEINFNLIQ